MPLTYGDYLNDTAMELEPLHAVCFLGGPGLQRKTYNSFVVPACFCERLGRLRRLKGPSHEEILRSELRTFLGSSSAIVGPSWLWFLGLLKPSFERFETILGHLAYLETILRPFWSLLKHLGAFLGAS